MFKTKIFSAVTTSILISTLATAQFASAEEEEKFSTYALNQQMLMATVWVEASSEFKALSYQSFNLAKYRLNDFLEGHKKETPFAVIVDVDETIISNARYEAWLIADGIFHSGKRQKLWADAAIAPALPGAVEFLNYVQGHGGEVFYVTNRKDDTREGTLRNLSELNFPFSDNDHLLTKSKTSDKEDHRRSIASNFEIALLMGDNLNDFSSDFDTETFAETDAAVVKNRKLFGDRFILLPNPMYGEWESKLYEDNWRLPNSEKSKRRNEILKTWRPDSQ
ncbi:5'-nucleotidase, lipoprotein e(P4) family [Marinobacterium sp. LSUCC0821]|uniref:5'-nucleotidase, lipoprotein e(P4) family n=1 Tax=Marinobacterium sp. LSUCC0821 TaxID=2668067 RepID=UPI0014511961|nr:5'-nucleotidase, lipoprotein e(P4) family [Marinobacterium sp. LSUCC0821]QJD70657.1 5'-nucleotidase, lipoprotein e(P4) family [Marinobacterium sp. LSUCC0821]